YKHKKSQIDAGSASEEIINEDESQIENNEYMLYLTNVVTELQQQVEDQRLEISELKR
ncbi:2045_t:CDS:1, partial [Dentiscutata heterogama]